MSLELERRKDMTVTPKILFMPHANIQYSQLQPSKRVWVIKNSYEKLFDLVGESDYRIAFEASGETINLIAKNCPNVLKKLKNLIKNKKLEPVASPYTHIMLSNIDPEIGLATLKDGLDVWEKYTGVRPETGWNPECGWASYMPEIYKRAGFKILVMDADSFLLSFKKIREATGLKFDVQGHSNKNLLFKIEEYIKDKPEFLRYLTNPSKFNNGLIMVFRSDMMSNLMLWYLMGVTEEAREKPVSLDEIKVMLEKWKKRIKETGAFIMPYAEDSEYIGTSAYFYVKQFGLARFFEPEPESIVRFKQLLDLAKQCGYTLSTPTDVVKNAKNIIKNEFVKNIENGVAWHGGTAKAWANTKYSRIMDPVCKSIFDGIKEINKYLKKNFDTMDAALKNALKKVISAYVSDSRWPPDPVSPGRFNVKESIKDLFDANEFVKQSMKKNNIESVKSLYSPDIMMTQIEAIEGELMKMKYFGEK